MVTFNLCPGPNGLGDMRAQQCIAPCSQNQTFMAKLALENSTIMGLSLDSDLQRSTEEAYKCSHQEFGEKEH